MLSVRVLRTTWYYPMGIIAYFLTFAQTLPLSMNKHPYYTCKHDNFTIFAKSAYIAVVNCKHLCYIDDREIHLTLNDTTGDNRQCCKSWT